MNIEKLESDLKANCLEMGAEYNPNNYNSDYFHHAAMALAFLYCLHRKKWPDGAPKTPGDYLRRLVETKGAGSMHERMEKIVKDIDKC